jgi:spore coat polysaccharide biosynthesis protein SpsF
MVKILAIIQARMGSSRLPGKVMLPILGKPMIWHIYNRLKTCKNVEQICIATSTNALDDQIEKFANKENIHLFRGSEDQIINRLLGAARKFNADVIVRVTADCPLIDPEIIDQLIKIYLNNSNIDFVSNTIERTFPDGLDVEVISTNFLGKLLVELKESQEWFIMHIIENHRKYRCLNYKNLENLSKLRWTVDYKEDYEFVKAIYQELFDNVKIFHMQDILNLLTRKPNILKLNQKYSADTSTQSYLAEKKKNSGDHK